MQRLLLSLIDIYQKYLSFDKGILAIFAPGGACRHEISCSEYSKQAILKYGTLKGVARGFKRILTCTPLIK